MKKILIVLLLLPGLFLLGGLSVKADSGIVYTDSDYERLSAVIEHVENILYYGHAYNENTALLPDAVNTLTGEPAVWTFPNRAEVPYADLANQQNFFRTLVALSLVTGDSRYRNEAFATLTEFMDNYQNANGLFYWGGHRVVNLDTLLLQSTESDNGPHELKNMLPYYELMLEVNPTATIRFMQQLWTAHFDWAEANLNRHGSYSTGHDNNVFGEPMIADIIQFDEDGMPIIPSNSPGDLPFVNAASDLAYAAFTLSDYTGDPAPRAWGEYLMRQYHLASNPVTGMTVYQYKSTLITKTAEECAIPSYTNSGCGDRVARQFRDFGAVARESNVQWKNVQAMYVDNILMLLEAADKYGIDYYVDWAKGYLEGFLDYAYIRIDGQNKIIPMFNDGTVTYGYIVPEVGYYGPSNMRLDYVEMSTSYLLPILRTILAIEDPADQVKLWTYFREIVQAFGLGDVGPLGGTDPALDLATAVSDPFALMAMVELYEATGNVQYLDSARTIGNNIVKEQFFRGFFVESEIMLYSRLDQPETLALLILDGVLRGYRIDDLPYYLADSGYIHGYLLADDGVTEDRNYSTDIIYTKTIYD